MNTLSKKGLEKYTDRFFSVDGYKTLMVYVKNLIGMYLKKGTTYPFSYGMVFGIPFFDWAHIIKSKEELYIKIKAAMELLGIESMTIDDGRSAKTFKLSLEKKEKWQ